MTKPELIKSVSSEDLASKVLDVLKIAIENKNELAVKICGSLLEILSKPKYYLNIDVNKEIK